MTEAKVSFGARNYLDHAATGWPKPEAVYLAMDRYAREMGATAGRGEYRAAMAANERVASCRRRLARMIGANHSNQVAFFSSGTAALNAAIFGVVQKGDRVITTSIEHNSVLRPLEALRQRGEIELTIVPADAAGYVDLGQLLESVHEQTSLVAVSHASNVTGAVQPIAEIGERLAATQTLFLCDAAQSLGYLPINVQESAIDLLASPGHKGAMGPLGTGMLFVSEKAKRHLRPTVFGGTGSISQSLDMPTEMPTLLEPGNLNVPAIAGWDAGLMHWETLDVAELSQRRRQLCDRLRNSLSNLPGCKLAIVGAELPLASLVFENTDPNVIGGLLDSEFSIDVRSGLHCAALVHDAIRKASGVDSYKGTLRMSAGHFTRPEQIDAAATAIKELLVELSST